MSPAHLDTHSDILHAVQMPSSARESQPDLSSWPTHTEAAQRLGTNERTIHRWIAAGRLTRAYRPATGRKPIVVVDPADLEQIRRERLPPVVMAGDPDGSMQHVRMVSESEPAAVERHRGPDGDPFAGLAAHLARLAAAFPTPQPKPWLTLDEAAEYSGLPRAWLIAQARSGALRAVNVGQGTKEFWRFNREGLAK